MLKKLVKYGNSNALILEKAILELLDIEEGSMVRIRTDGKSIIITPAQQQPTEEKVSPTYTATDATMQASVQESLKHAKVAGPDIEKELVAMSQKLYELTSALDRNAEFGKKMDDLRERLDVASVEFWQAYQALRVQYAPELVKLEKEMKDKWLALGAGGQFEGILKLDEKQTRAMQVEHAALAKKYKHVWEKYTEILNDEEFQHEMQLLAERYKNDKNSKEYMEAYRKVLIKYVPEFKAMWKEMKALNKKYAKKG